MRKSRIGLFVGVVALILAATSLFLLLWTWDRTPVLEHCTLALELDLINGEVEYNRKEKPSDPDYLAHFKGNSPAAAESQSPKTVLACNPAFANATLQVTTAGVKHSQRLRRSPSKCWQATLPVRLETGTYVVVKRRKGAILTSFSIPLLGSRIADKPWELVISEDGLPLLVGTESEGRRLYIRPVGREAPTPREKVGWKTAFDPVLE